MLASRRMNGSYDHGAAAAKGQLSRAAARCAAEHLTDMRRIPNLRAEPDRIGGQGA
jgi:hypothetical protein